ncbi:MAG: FixH family protein [Rhodospirillales bacterium]|jgi:nitrogen fixation protein FixH|nr:FixH family protein [Rhodospirillales bacterium]
MSTTTTTRRRGPRSAWDWFPWAVAASLAVVILVNAGMIWAALATFPGQAGEDGFDLSNSFNEMLRAAAQQKALGWHVTLGVDPAGHLGVALAGPDGRPLPGAAVRAVAERPVGPRDTRHLALPAQPGGGFRAAQPLARGRWMVALTIRAAGHLYAIDRQLIVEEPVPQTAR